MSSNIRAAAREVQDGDMGQAVDDGARDCDEHCYWFCCEGVVALINPIIVLELQQRRQNEDCNVGLSSTESAEGDVDQSSNLTQKATSDRANSCVKFY